MSSEFRIGGRARIRREVDEELAFHLEMRARQLVARGMDPERARAEALQQFGDVGGVREDCVALDRERERAMDRADLFDALRQDLGFAVRTLRRNAGFTAVVVLTLALGIGANTGIFTLVNAVLLRTLPVREPATLVAIGDPGRVTSVSQGDQRGDLFSVPLYRDIREHGGPLTGLLASGRAERLDVRVDSGAAAAEHPRGRFVSANYFQVLGVPAFRGRVFDGTEDGDVGAAPVVTISHGWWTRRFNRDPRVIGRTISLNGVGVTIIGVAPPAFTGDVVGLAPDLWIPLGLQPLVMPHERRLDDRTTSWLLLLGRLAPGATVDQARAELAPFIRQDIADHSGLPGGVADQLAARLTVPVASGARGFSRVRETYRVPLITLQVGVALLLLIICANVANLLLARAVARSREMSVRMAIGAGRARLVRQLLTESALLGLLGAAGGLLLAWWASRILLALAADGASAIPLDTSLDLPVLGFTAGLSLLAVLLAGLAPALKASRVDLAAAMNASARSVGELGARDQRIPVGRMLIAAQVALSLVLLIGAALFVRNLRQLQSADAGLDRDHLLIVELDAVGRGYRGERMTQLASDLARRFGALPGVAAVSFSENGIFSGTESANTFQVPGFTPRESGDTSAFYDQVGPGYFAAIGGRLVRGREFTEHDTPSAPRVVIINQTMARFYFGGDDAVGRTLRFDDSTSAEIVGVAADVKDHSLEGEPVRRFYLPFLQGILGTAEGLRLIVRSAGDPAALGGPVRDLVTGTDAQLGIDGIDPLTFLMRRSIREERLVARLAGGFGVLALVLAAIGLYGVMTYAITRRTGEMGLRLALGAQRGDVIRLVLGDAMRVVGIGFLVGVPLALGVTRLLRGQLAGIGSADPVSFAVAAAVLLASAAVAALIPAVRASRVGPLVALRQSG